MSTNAGVDQFVVTKAVEYVIQMRNQHTEPIGGWVDTLFHLECFQEEVLGYRPAWVGEGYDRSDGVAARLMLNKVRKHFDHATYRLVRDLRIVTIVEES